MNPNPINEDVRLDQISEAIYEDSYVAPPPPMIGRVQEAIDPDNPPWGIGAGLLTWLASALLLFIFQVLFLTPYFVANQAKGVVITEDALMKSPTVVLLLVISIIPAHIVTIGIVWMVVTGWRRRPFRKTLGWTWDNSFILLVSPLLAVFLLVIGGLITYFMGGNETDIDRIVKVSLPARFALAFIAAFTAPLTEELVYRGILYPTSKKSPGQVSVRVGVGLLAFFPLIWLLSPAYKFHILAVALFLLTLGLGILITPLKDKPTATAIVEVSLLFALVHIPQYKDNYGVIVVILLLSFVLTVLRAKTGKILPCIMVHFIFNGIQAIIIVAQPYLQKYVSEPKPQQGFIVLENFIRLFF